MFSGVSCQGTCQHGCAELCNPSTITKVNTSLSKALTTLELEYCTMRYLETIQSTSTARNVNQNWIANCIDVTPHANYIPCKDTLKDDKVGRTNADTRLQTIIDSLHKSVSKQDMPIINELSNILYYYFT